MDSLQGVRKKFTIALGALGALDLLLLGYLLWPGTGYSALQARDRELDQKLKTLNQEIAPLIGMDEKLAKTRVDVKMFYEQRVPAIYSEISQHLDKLGKANGVDAQSVHYVTEKADKGDLPDVQRITIDTTVTGDYAKVARFINAVEQDSLLFVITQVQLSSREGGTVSLQIKLEAFLRETT